MIYLKGVQFSSSEQKYDCTLLLEGKNNSYTINLHHAKQGQIEEVISNLIFE